MNKAQIAKMIDHTILKAEATESEIIKLCKEAIHYDFASVCVNPSMVPVAAKELKGTHVKVCTVIGFPLGATTTEVKVFETKDVIEKGATEVDMVINIGHVKNGDFDKVEAEIKALKEAAGDKILKVIIETCYLTDDEKVKLCQCVTNAKADYIKTSTGFGTGGATIEDIRLFAQNIGPDVKMKAAGGVKSREDLEIFLEAGCDRIGTSSAVKMLEEN